MRRIAVLALVCVTALAGAHQEGVSGLSAAYDCEHPPTDAVVQLPAKLGVVGRLVCLPAGPGILANHGWSWRYTGSFFELPTITAYAHVDSAGMPAPFYFTRLSARDLSNGEAAKLSAQLQRDIATYQPDGVPAAMSVFEVVNNYGRRITVFMPMESKENGWLIVCTPECRADYVILVNRLLPN